MFTATTLLRFGFRGLRLGDGAAKDL